MASNVHVFRKTSNPSAAPTDVGQHWINTTTGVQWLSVGTSSVDDWLPASAAGGSFISSVIGDYKISTTVGPTPSSGQLRYNNATQTSATQLLVAELTDSGIDVSVFLNLIGPGAALIIQDKNDSANYQIWTVSSAPTDSGTYRTIPVTLASSGGTGTTGFANNHEVFFAGLTAGGVTSVTASSPLASSGGATPNITIQTASGSQSGALSSTDWTTFNNKQAALGFTPENVANKDTTTTLGTSNTLYPTQNAVKTYVDTQNTPVTSAISASDINWATLLKTGGLYTKTLAANTTFTFSNATAGQTIIVRLTNTASNYTVTWPTVKWSGGAAPTMTVGAKSDVYTFIYDGTSYFGSAVQDMY